MLTIKDLCVEVEETPILRGLNLTVKPGEIHAIMGPNGSGKSTLSKALAGHPDYEVTGGEVNFEINFKQKNLLDIEPEERAREGVFLAFQYPTEVPGVSNFEFLRAAFNASAKHQGFAEMDVLEFDEFVEKKLELIGMKKDFLKRQLNAGFSGGEKKRNEILQMAVLSPKLAILDETDSGLDVDSMRAVAEGVNKLHTPDNAIIMITHYQRLLDHIEPDFVHILHNGQIVKSGDKQLAKEIEANGYESFIS